VAVDVTSERVEYHQDTVNYLVQREVDRCISEKIPLTLREIKLFKRLLVKTLIIGHNAEKAVNLKIK
jgi:hypothetical protein